MSWMQEAIEGLINVFGPAMNLLFAPRYKMSAVIAQYELERFISLLATIEYVFDVCCISFELQMASMDNGTCLLH